MTDDRTDDAYAELIDPDDQPTLLFERMITHPRSKVWRALIEDEHLGAWFPTTIEGDRVTGAPLRFEFRPDDEYAAGLPGFDGRMIAVEEASLLELAWGEHVLRFELADGPTEGTTSLTLRVRLEELGVAARDAAGWHVCLAGLVHLLDGTPAGPPDAWKAVNADYNERFGPAASAIGPPEGHRLG